MKMMRKVILLILTAAAVTGIGFAAAEPAVFEGFACRKPVGWDPWLTMHYGDYMQLPPEEKRVSHHVDRT